MRLLSGNQFNTESKMKKIKKIEPYTPQWERMANSLARDYAPTIKPCKECGHPVIDGYCCGFCKSVNP